MAPLTPATIFRNGALFDGTRYRGPLGDEIVLVVGGVVAGVGDAASLPVPAGAHEVDLVGGLLSPGFIDAHVHTMQGGLERLRCDLTGGETLEEYLDLVAAYAEQHPDRAWILGGGWSMDAFPGGTPHARDLDRVVPDRPALLPNRDHHGAWVNSRALELAGVTRDTADPHDGRIERDAEGNPTGTLHEGAVGLVARLVPRTSKAEKRAGLLEGQRYLHALGVTGWQDAIVGDYDSIEDCGPAYRALADTGELTGRVVGALWWDRNRGTEQIADLVARRERFSGGRFQATSVKIMQDGVAENYTASMSTPYVDRCGHPTANSGHSFVDAAALIEAVSALDEAGFQIHVHTIGDRALRETLDAFAALPDPRRGRHHVAHLQVVDPRDVPRFAELGVSANIQSYWAVGEEQMNELTIPFLGPERARWQYPFGALARAGAHLCAGSDWPVSTPDPFAAIHVAVNRVEHGADTEPFLPEYALSLEQAMAAYTSGSAWINHGDELAAPTGHIRAGCAADLVVLDRDPFAGPVEEIGATTVTSTWVEGRVVSTR